MHKIRFNARQQVADLNFLDLLIVEPACEIIVEPIVKPIYKSVVKPVVQPIVKSVVQPIVQPIVKSVIKPVIKSAVKPNAPQNISKQGSLFSAHANVAKSTQNPQTLPNPKTLAINSKPSKTHGFHTPPDTSSAVGASSRAPKTTNNLSRRLQLEEELTDPYEMEFNDVIRDIFGCKGTTGIESQPSLIIAHVYLSMRHSTATEQQLSKYFKAFYQINDCDGDKIRTIRHCISGLDNAKTDQELHAYLNKRCILEPGSERAKRVQKLRASKRPAAISPHHVLGNAIWAFNQEWREMSDYEKDASVCEWEDRPYTPFSDTRQIKCDQVQFQRTPDCLLEKLVPGVFRIDGLSKIEEDFLVHITFTGNLPKQLQPIVLAHVFLCAHHAHTIPLEQLSRFFQKHYLIQFRPTAIRQLADRIRTLQSYESRHAEHLADFLDLNSGKFKENLSKKDKVEVWRKAEKALDHEWMELGAIRRMTSYQEWRMMFDTSI